jgi:siroheme synthase
VIKILEHYEPGQFEKIEAAKNALSNAETFNGTLLSLVKQEEKLVKLGIGNPAVFGEFEAEKLTGLRKAIEMQWNALEARRRLAEMPVRKVFTNVYEVGGKIADLEVGECSCDASFINQEICEHLLKAKEVKSNGY